MSGQNKIVDNSPLIVRVGFETSTAIISAFTVAPAISIVDTAIVSNASGKEQLLPCLINGIKTCLSRPLFFLKQPAFLMIWGVYGGTYTAANNIEALCLRNNNSPLYPKFFGSAAANVSLSVMKDKAYARLFGVGEPKPFPKLSYGLFAARDSMTVLASFTLPKYVGKSLSTACNMEASSADNLAQLITPCVMQLFSCPLHLHGLDLYNRPVAADGTELTNANRMQFIRQEYWKTAAARIARIFPAFGIGGVVNKYVRMYGNKKLKEYYP